MRVGIGFDVHPFDYQRPLVMGGVTIEGAPGLAGWSDADVIAHAIVDAMLGGAGIGDLGMHFPESEVEAGESSLKLLERASILIAEAGLRITNVDVTVIVQNVRISHHRAEMEETIAGRLGIETGTVNVKATTTDFLGAIGRSEGAGALAVVALRTVD